MKIIAQAATSARGPLAPFEYEARPLGPDEVDVAVTHCGICHTDVGMVDNEWGISAYPFVPGHEAIGRIVGLGDVAAEKASAAKKRDEPVHRSPVSAYSMTDWVSVTNFLHKKT